MRIDEGGVCDVDYVRDDWSGLVYHVVGVIRVFYVVACGLDLGR